MCNILAAMIQTLHYDSGAHLTMNQTCEQNLSRHLGRRPTWPVQLIQDYEWLLANLDSHRLAIDNLTLGKI